MSEDIRWKQRFHNFTRAYTLLGEVVLVDKDITENEPIVKEGIVQRFEFTFEMAWKTLKDKMEHDGLVIEKVSPKPLLKLAYQSKYIDNIELWLEMASDRNLMSHTYNFAIFDQVLRKLQLSYYPLLSNLYDGFVEAILDE